MSVTEKWRLLEQYDRSTMDLIKNKPKSSTLIKSRKSKELSAKDIITSLESGRANKNTLNRLQSSLTSDPNGWAPNFIKAGGCAALVKYVNTNFKKSV